MSRRTAVVAAVLAALLALPGCASDGGTGGGGTAKDALPAPMPEVTLAGFGDDPDVDLAAIDSPTVLSLWASWCTPCRKEMPIIEEFAQKYAGRIDVLGVNFQDAQSEAAEELAAETGVTYPIVTDLEGRLDGLDPMPRVRGLPFLAFVDGDGELVGTAMELFDDLAEFEELVLTHLEPEGQPS